MAPVFGATLFIVNILVETHYINYSIMSSMCPGLYQLYVGVLVKYWFMWLIDLHGCSAMVVEFLLAQL